MAPNRTAIRAGHLLLQYMTGDEMRRPTVELDM